MGENTTYLKEIGAEGYTGHNSEHPFWMVEQGAKSDELFINWQRASGKRGSRICRVWNGPVGRAANANLLAAAPKMAAEIDRLRDSLASAESRLAIAVGCLEKLTTACEKDFCSPATATCTGAVGGGKDGDMAVTFEMIRESRSALAEVAIQKGKQ